MTTTPSVRLSERAKRWVTKILKEDHSLNHESVVWDVSVAVFPDPAAVDEPAALVPLPALVIYLEIPGADPDTSLYISPIIAPYQLDEQRVHRAVTGALSSMRARRQELLDNPESAD